MTIRVGINGFGRIGRNFFRVALDSYDIDVVAVNDGGSIEKIAHLLKYDTVHGRIEASVVPGDHSMRVNGKSFAVLSDRDPARLPWADHGVDIVIEATGAFLDGESAGAHLGQGAQKVIISAPADCDVTIVPSVNADHYKPDVHHVISAASCTTNCLAPMLRVLDQNFGVESGLLATVHAYTGDQAIVDGSHTDLRRGRAAAVNVVPTSTGAAKAIGLVMPELAGRFDGSAMRVPVVNGSIADFVGILNKDVTLELVDDAFREAAASGPLSTALDYSNEPLVSSDIVGSPASCTYDAGLTMVHRGLVKVCGWYDNEWGYSSRLVDLVHLVAPERESMGRHHVGDLPVVAAPTSGVK